jgi:hypothetical protein
LFFNISYFPTRNMPMPIDPLPPAPSPPTLILDGDPRRAQAVTAIVRDLGGGPIALDQAAQAAVVLRAPGYDGPSPGGIPTLSYGAPSAARWSTSLPAPGDAAFTSALSPWLDDGGALRRIAALFGDDAVAPMAARLVEDLARFIPAPDLDRDAAHRLGGFAGTLGFRRLAHCAERVSQGDDAFLGSARREAAGALDVVARYRASLD